MSTNTRSITAKVSFPPSLLALSILLFLLIGYRVQILHNPYFLALSAISIIALLTLYLAIDVRSNTIHNWIFIAGIALSAPICTYYSSSQIQSLVFAMDYSVAFVLIAALVTLCPSKKICQRHYSLIRTPSPPKDSQQ